MSLFRFKGSSWQKVLALSLALPALLGSGSMHAQDSPRDRLLNDTSLSLLASFDGHADADASESGIVATQVGTFTFEPGVLGDSISFGDTGQDSVRYPATKSFDPEKGTMMFWFKPQWEGASAEGKYTLAWITMKGSPKYFAFHRSFNADPQATFVNFHWDNSFQAPSRLLFSQGTWTHFAITWNAEQQQYALYKNGELLLEKPWNPLDSSQYISQTLLLGNFYPSDSPINAAYDDMMLFKRALAPHEIQEYYKQLQPQ